MTRIRGFTLVELMVALTVTALTIGIAISAFVGQNASMVSNDLTRIANDSARDAFFEMEGSLRRAGLGVQSGVANLPNSPTAPAYTFDFTTYQCPAAPCRDSVNGSDELVFIARNPNYNWTAVGATIPGTSTACTTTGGCFLGKGWNVTGLTQGNGTAGQITIKAHGGEVFYPGQVVEVVCQGGAAAALFTLNAGATAPITGGTLGLAFVGATDPYSYGNVTANACLAASASPAMFVVDRFRYFVRTYNGTPWLMLDTGLDATGSGIGNVANWIPIAKNVEDLQVSYGLVPVTGATAPDNNADWIFGNNANGTPEEPTGTFQGNKDQWWIRTVRLTLSLRSDSPDPVSGLSAGDPFPMPVENRNANAPALAQYKRFRYQSVVDLRNMSATALSIF